MGIPVQKILSELPKKRQARIKTKADKYIQEYETLGTLRRTMGLTQEDIARKQGVRQVNISNLEKRHDMLISTLNNYVQALGGKLEIRIKLSPTETASIKAFTMAKTAARGHRSSGKISTK